MTSTEKLATSFKALAANSAETNVKKTDLYRIPPDKLQEEEGFNARDYDDPEVIAQIESFADAYSNGRYVPPLIVRIDSGTGGIFVVEGHLRRKGANLAIERGAPIQHLDCTPFRGNDTDRVTVMLTSAQGLPLKPLGVAESYLRLTRMGLSVADISKRLCRTVTHVENMLTLATSNSDVHTMVRKGEVAATTAIEAVRKHGDKAGNFLAGKLQEAKASGKTSVKPSAIKPWVPPRKMVTTIYDSLAPVFKSLEGQDDAQALLSQAEGADAEPMEGKRIWVDAAALAKLCRAFQDAEALKLKRSKGGEPEPGEPSSDDQEVSDEPAA